MALDYVVRDPRGIAGMEFHVDGLVMSMSDTHTHLMSIGFTGQESSRYMRKLIEEDKSIRLVYV